MLCTPLAFPLLGEFDATKVTSPQVNESAVEVTGMLGIIGIIGTSIPIPWPHGIMGEGVSVFRPSSA